MPRRLVIVLGASADIGSGFVKRFAADGWDVIGTYRSPSAAAALDGLEGVTLLRCDVSSPAEVASLADAVAGGTPWNVLVSAVGRLDPIGPWEELEFEAWERSVRDNSTAQLRALHALLPFRERDGAHAAFFAGGGTNGPFRNYSAYCLAKIVLIKTCELLHDEIADLNAFIVGPGFLPTKIHRATLADAQAAGDNHAKTLAFYEHASEALTIDDVYQCVRWCIDQGRDVVGGRNIAAAHDAWQTEGARVASTLRGSADAWRLRRAALPIRNETAVA
jgi:NAD(P)-dependent dehydrogenase (short-subunit alcohol dehydrogenase family)